MGPAVSADYARASCGLTAVTTPLFPPSFPAPRWQSLKVPLLSPSFTALALLPALRTATMPCPWPFCGLRAASTTGGFRVATPSRQGPRPLPSLRPPCRGSNSLPCRREHRRDNRCKDNSLPCRREGRCDKWSNPLISCQSWAGPNSNRK